MAYPQDRPTFARAFIAHQGRGFVLAAMAAPVESARATYLAAARLKDAGRPFSRQASIAKLICTDNAMQVTTNAVQVLGGAGYTRDFPVERYLREAKVMQIFEGTHKIQGLHIRRNAARRPLPQPPPQPQGDPHPPSAHARFPLGVRGLRRGPGRRRMGRYTHLSRPLRLGPLTLKSRVVFSAHLTNYAEDGKPTEQHAAYYAARAAGGAGLIITEEHSTPATDRPYEKPKTGRANG